MTHAATDTQQPVVAVENLSRRYRKKQALNRVSLTVPQGVVYGLVGENGAGKTTLVKHILGTLRAKEGAVRVFGLEPAANPVDVLSRIGYLSEDRDLPGWMRVRELMDYTAAFYSGWDAAYAGELRQRFHLDPEARIKSLSRGEKAKMGLLTALAYRPPLLLLDEPSSGLDPSARRDIVGAIVRTVADEGRTVIFSSHILEEVERVADVVCMLHAGQCVFEGPLDDVKARHHRMTLRLPETLTALPPLPGVLRAEGSGREYTVLCDGAAEELRTAASAQGVEIVEEARPTLEEIFLARVAPVQEDMP